MKRFPCILLGVAALSCGTHTQAAEAITGYGSFPALPGYAHGGAGFEFAPNRDVAITQLGYGGEDILKEPIRIVLWDTNGVSLCSALVTTNSPFFNFCWYEPVRPLILRAGVTYYLSGAEAAENVWVGYMFYEGGFEASPDISYFGAALGTNSEGIFPYTLFPSTAWPIGANFQYVTGQLVVIDGARVQNGQIQLQTSLGGGAFDALLLLEAEQPGGPWTTNSTLVVATNIPGASYTLTATANATSRFFRIGAPVSP